MKKLFLAVLLTGGTLLAQDSSVSQDKANPDNSKDSKNAVTMQGCVSRTSGDYMLMKQNPTESLELQATNKIRLRQYLGQRVEVTGTQSASMSTSSDAIARMGSPSPVTLTVTSIKTLDKRCSERPAE